MGLLQLSGESDEPTVSIVETGGVLAKIRMDHLPNKSQSRAIYEPTSLVWNMCFANFIPVQLVKTFPLIMEFETSMFICHSTQSWARLGQPTPSHPISVRSLLILYSHLCSDLICCLFPRGLPFQCTCQLYYFLLNTV